MKSIENRKHARHIKKLLKKLLKYVKNIENKGSGLCSYVYLMHLFNHICYSERLVLEQFIKMHRPKKNNKFFHPVYIDKDHYWPPWDKNIRIEWLKYKIKQINKKYKFVF